MLIIGETQAARRVIPAYLRDANQVPLPLAYVFGADDIKIISPAGVATSIAAGRIVPTPGSVLPGSFRILWDAEVDAIGLWEWQAVSPLIYPWNYVDAADVAEGRGYYDTIIEGPDQYDGNGEATPVGHTADEYNVTAAQALREILAYCSGPANNLDGVQGIPGFVSRVGGRTRFAGPLVNGNRSITSRDND